jgi:hypothetical protein
MRFDHQIVDVAAREHAGKLVANELADAQLALRAACGLSVMVLTRHLSTAVMRGLRRTSRFY